MHVEPSPENRNSDAPWLFFSFDDQGMLLEGNHTISHLTGISLEKFQGTHINALLTKSGQMFNQTHFLPVLQLEGRADEVFLLLRNVHGEALPVLAYGTRWQNKEGKWINECFCAPIPQRQKFERELIEARKAAETVVRENLLLNQAKQALEDQHEELDQRIRQLEQANDELRQIAKIVSHDLQEPLRKITILIDYGWNNADQSLVDYNALLGKIGTICFKTSHLITGLRDYIALDSEEHLVAPVELEKLIRKAAHNASEANQYAGDWLLSSQLPIVSGNARLLEQAFFQIFDNSIKFRKQEIPLRVQLTADIIKENKYLAVDGRYQYTDHVRICIKDNGMGFSPKYRNDVFVLLKKLVKNIPTLGLGLAISKKIVAKHYGTITADSMPGVGTTITILLPV